MTTTSNNMRCVLVLYLCLVFKFGFNLAFQCQSCAYSYSEENPDKDTACILQPEVYTGWSVLKCSDYCVVQEIYNKEKQRVVAYWRSCSDKPDTGYCSGDDWVLTCHHSCRGDLCNSWVRGQLHVIYGDIKPPEKPRNGASPVALASTHVFPRALRNKFIFTMNWGIFVLILLCILFVSKSI